MPNNWTKCKLGDVVDKASTGLDAIRRAPIVPNNTGIKCLRIQDVSQNKPISNWGYCNVSTNDYNKFKLLKEDILIARTGASVGVNMLVEEDIPSVFNNGLIRIKCSKKTISKYIHYSLQSDYFKNHIYGIAFGTVAQPNIQIRDLLGFKINLPPLDEQKRIAGVLGAFDDKIELLQKQNKTLEDMAKAIFKSWFVDFDIVKAKERGEDKQKILSTYKITEELYNLFPSSFTDAPASSSLGPIPTGWEVKQIKDIAILTMGQSPSGNTYNEAGEGLPFYQGRTDFGFRFPSKRVYCSKPTRIAQAHDILISVRAPVGDLNIALEECCIGRGVGSIRSNTSDYSFIYYSLLNIQNALKSFDNEGTVFGSINKDTLSSLKVIYPQQILVNEYDNLTSKLDNKIEANTKQIQTLTELRDGLLPRLLSGKLKV